MINMPINRLGIKIMIVIPTAMKNNANPINRRMSVTSLLTVIYSSSICAHLCFMFYFSFSFASSKRSDTSSSVNFSSFLEEKRSKRSGTISKSFVMVS